MTEEQHLAVRDALDGASLLPDRSTVERQLRAVRDFQETVRRLFIANHDFGVIPGTGAKPTLLKPGAEKLAKLLGLADQYEIVDRLEDWDRPLFRYVVKCRLVHLATGNIVSEGVGECNSMENRYRWRWVWPNEVPDAERERLSRIPGAVKEFQTSRGKSKKYRVENDDIYSQVNTLLKMAKKRALVDAALSAGRLSDLFTQDLEDIAANGGGVIEGEASEATEQPRSQPRPQRKAESSEPPADEKPSQELLDSWTKLVGMARELNIALPTIRWDGLTHQQLLGYYHGLKDRVIAARKRAQEEPDEPEPAPAA